MKLPFDSQPTLEGTLLQLRPMIPDDFSELFLAASDPLIWEQHPQPIRYQKPIFRDFFEGGLKSGGALTVIEKKSQALIGSSRFYNVQSNLSEITIGYTFLARAFWGGKFNLEMKTLMLNHAFLSFDNVHFEVGENNVRSRTAVEKLGAILIGEQKRVDGTRVIYQLDSASFNWKLRKS